MNAKHTPAPWRITESGDVRAEHILVAAVYPMEKHNPVENKANAALIAAAPDLLAALQVITLDPRLSVFVNTLDRQAFAQARAAVSKALGETK